MYFKRGKWVSHAVGLHNILNVHRMHTSFFHIDTTAIRIGRVCFNLVLALVSDHGVQSDFRYICTYTDRKGHTSAFRVSFYRVYAIDVQLCNLAPLMC